MRLTKFKFPFVAFECAIGAVATRQAFHWMDVWPIMLGYVGLALLAFACAGIILTDDDGYIRKVKR